MITELKLEIANGKIKSPASTFKPTTKEAEVTKMVLEDFSLANEIRNKPYTEFNNKSLLERINEDQKSWNSYQESGSDDPELAWKSNAIRPITRNKIISIAAHITGSIIYPQVFAQNENDDDDKDAAQVMRDLMEWSYDQSEYDKTFVYAVISACVNPAVVIEDNYSESYRTIKEIISEEKWETKSVLDEEFSGFKNPIVPLDEFFIADIYEPNIQRHPFIIRRRAINFSTAMSKYKDNPNFEFVKPGIQSLFDENSGMFYEVQDNSLDGRLVEEVRYYNRQLDLELVFLNGIIVTNPEQPNPRQDKKYPFVKFGYEPINDRFFYYKSLAFKLAPDQGVIDTLYQMVIDGSFMQMWPAGVVYGNEEINSSIITPGKITRFTDPETKFDKIDTGANLNSGFNTIQLVEKSLAESSMDVLQQGMSIKGSQTAFEISKLEENARIMLGLFGKMIGFAIEELGKLRADSIIQYMTVGDVSDISGPSGKLKFKKFTLNNRNVGGKSKTRNIQFDMDLPDEMNKEEALNKSFDILNQEGGLDSDKEIFKVNPTKFRKSKFLFRVYPEMVVPPSDRVKKAFNLEEYDRAVQSPLADQEALYKDLLLGSYDTTKDNVDKYVKKQEPMQTPGLADQLTGGIKGSTTKSPVSEVLGAENKII
jgi:hypothetical protein